MTKLYRSLIVAVFTFCSISSHSANDVDVNVDASIVLNEFDRNPIGLNLNALLDKHIPEAAISEINAKSLRYPLGEVADLMLFNKDNPGQMKVAVQDPEFTFTNSNFTKLGHSVWKDNLQFDRFVSLAKTQNASPYIVVGIDAYKYEGPHPHASKSEIIQAAKDWVHYANIEKDYGIQYWEIGNENDLESLHVNGVPRVKWSPEEYGDFVVEMSRAMKSVDPSIKVSANGMTTEDWWNTLLPIVKDDIDFVVTHQYSSIQSHGHWVTSDWTSRSHIMTARKALDDWNIDIPISVTEISSLSLPNPEHWNNTWKALHNLEMFGNALEVNGVDQLHMWISSWLQPNPMSGAFAAFNQKKDYELLPMGYATKIWGSSIGKNMVRATGSDTVLSWASVSADNAKITVFLLNKHPTEERKVHLNIDGFDADSVAQVLEFGGNSSTDVAVNLTRPDPANFNLDQGISVAPNTFLAITINSKESARSNDSNISQLVSVSGIKRIKNRSHYLHASENFNWEPLVTHELVEKWWSQRWNVQTVDAQAGIVRISNLWTGRFLTVEDTLEASPVFLADGVDSWWSQQWIIESVPNSQDLRLRNRWTNKYLTMEDLDGGILVQSHANSNSMANRFRVLDI